MKPRKQFEKAKRGKIHEAGTNAPDNEGSPHQIHTLN